MYIKVNYNVSNEFQKVNKHQFQDVITKAYNEAIRKTKIQCNAFMDDSGCMGIYNLEICYI